MSNKSKKVSLFTGIVFSLLNGIFPASIDPRKNISAFVASMEKSRLSEIKFIAGAR